MQDNADMPTLEVKPMVTVFAIMGSAPLYEKVDVGELDIVKDAPGSASTHLLEVRKDRETIILRSRLDPRYNFRKQKGSIIDWVDSDQNQFQNLAISFSSETACDLYWRIICEKTGQNYLHISGEALDLPTAENLPVLFDKVTNSPELVGYHIVHCPEFLSRLFAVFTELVGSPEGSDSNIKYAEYILSSMISLNDPAVLTTLMSPKNFSAVLAIQDKRIPGLISIYQTTFRIIAAQFLDQNIADRAKTVLNCLFYREHVMTRTTVNDSLENLMLMVMRNEQTDMLSEILSSNFMEKLFESESPITTEHDSRITFILQLLLLQRKTNNDRFKTDLCEKVYQTNIILKIKDGLASHIEKAVDVLVCIAELNPTRFAKHLKVTHHLSSSALTAVLSKEYTLGSASHRDKILELFRQLGGQLKWNSSFSDYFISTFCCYVLRCCESTLAILELVLLLVEFSKNAITVIKDLIAFKPFERLTKESPKKQSLLCSFKILNLFLVNKKALDDLKSIRSAKAENQIATAYIIDSGLLSFCFEGVKQYLARGLHQNSLLSSILKECISIIQMMAYSPVHRFLLSSYRDCTLFGPLLAKVACIKQLPSLQQTQSQPYALAHHRELEDEKQEQYLLSAEQTAERTDGSPVTNKGDLAILESLTKQIRQLDDPNPRPIVKKTLQTQEFSVYLEPPDLGQDEESADT